MAGFTEGVSRDQTTLFPECLDDGAAEDNPVDWLASSTFSPMSSIRLRLTSIAIPPRGLAVPDTTRQCF